MRALARCRAVDRATRDCGLDSWAISERRRAAPAAAQHDVTSYTGRKKAPGPNTG